MDYNLYITRKKSIRIDTGLGIINGRPETLLVDFSFVSSRDKEPNTITPPSEEDRGTPKTITLLEEENRETADKIILPSEENRGTPNIITLLKIEEPKTPINVDFFLSIMKGLGLSLIYLTVDMFVKNLMSFIFNKGAPEGSNRDAKIITPLSEEDRGTSKTITPPSEEDRGTPNIITPPSEENREKSNTITIPKEEEGSKRETKAIDSPKEENRGTANIITPPLEEENRGTAKTITPPKEESKGKSNTITPPKEVEGKGKSNTIAPPKKVENRETANTIAPPKEVEGKGKSNTITPPKEEENRGTSKTITPPKKVEEKTSKTITPPSEEDRETAKTITPPKEIENRGSPKTINLATLYESQQKIEKEKIKNYSIGYILVIPQDESSEMFKIPFEFVPDIDEGGYSAQYSAQNILSRLGSLQNYSYTELSTASIETSYYALSEDASPIENTNDSWINLYTLDYIQNIQRAYQSLVLPKFPRGEEESSEKPFSYLKPPFIKVVIGESEKSTIFTYPLEKGDLKSHKDNEKRRHKLFMVTNVKIEKKLQESPLVLDNEGSIIDSFGFSVSLELLEVTKSYMDIYPDYNSYFNSFQPAFTQNNLFIGR